MLTFSRLEAHCYTTQVTRAAYRTDASRAGFAHFGHQEHVPFWHPPIYLHTRLLNHFRCCQPFFSESPKNTSRVLVISSGQLGPFLIRPLVNAGMCVTVCHPTSHTAECTGIHGA